MPDTRKTRARLYLLGLFLFFISSCTLEPVETDLLLPVDFSNVPEDMVLTHFHTDKIEIRIKGDPRHIDLIQKENIIYPADLYTDLEFDPAGDSNSIETGTYLLPVDKTRIPLDPAITILGISPSYLSVRLEKKVTKTFKVSVPYMGKPAKGHLALEPACNPPTVALTGPLSMLSSIEILKTKPIDLNNANESFKKEVPLDLENPLLYSSAQAMFIVTVPIQAKLGERTVSDIPIRIVNAKTRVKIEPSHISIDIKGPLETLGNKAVTEEIYAFMDLEGLKPGVYARHALINLPVDLVMTNASPQVFTVKIE